MTETSPSTDLLAGPKIILEGPSGTGKTYAIGTLVDWAQSHGVNVYCIFAENGLETLLGYWTDRKQPVPSNLKWCTFQTEKVGFDQLLKSAGQVGKMDYSMLSKLSDPTRSVNSAMERFLGMFVNFKDERTGEVVGPLDQTAPTDIIVVDSLSAINYFLTRLITGSRPVMAMGEYMVAQKFLYDFLFRCTQGLNQTFVLTAHVDRQMDEVMGGLKLMTKTPGSKLSTDIPPLFSEVILTVREGDKFLWDTANPAADLKSRYLPISKANPPTFAAIMDKWLIRAQGATK